MKTLIGRMAAFLLLVLASLFLGISPAFGSDPIGEYYIYLPLTASSAPSRPVPPPVDVYINLNSTFAYVNSYTGSLYVLGEVANNLGKDVSQVVVQARLYNAQGTLLDTQNAEIFLNTLEQGDKTCFSILFDKAKITGWASYEFDEPTYTLDAIEIRDLTLSNLAGTLNSTTKEYTITGLIRNNESTTTRCVRAVGSVYNGSDQVIGCAYSYVSATNLSAGSTGAFSILFYGRNYSDYAGFRVQADGLP